MDYLNSIPFFLALKETQCQEGPLELFRERKKLEMQVTISNTCMKYMTFFFYRVAKMINKYVQGQP